MGQDVNAEHFKNQYQIIQTNIAVNWKINLAIQSQSVHTFYLSLIEKDDTFQTITQGCALMFFNLAI